MNLTQKIKAFFPPLNVYIYYMLSSMGFCYVYYHKIFYYANFYQKDMGGIYYILSFEALKPNQYRLFIPFTFKLFKTIFAFVPDKGAYYVMILILTFFILVIFYNILNVYFKNRNVNQWMALVLLYPMIWHYVILNQMFDFTDFAYLFFLLAGYLCILKRSHKLLLLVFLAGTFNHDSTGFLIIMFLLFNIKDLFKKKTIFYASVMAVIFFAVKKLLEYIFISNPGISFRFNYTYNFFSFVTEPAHIVIRDIFLFFGGLHIFVLYFFISGRWKNFKTKYLFINLTIIPYIIIIFLIHTTFEARNYITAIPFVIILFLMFFTTQQNSFLKPLDAIKTDSKK